MTDQVRLVVAYTLVVTLDVVSDERLRDSTIGNLNRAVIHFEKLLQSSLEAYGCTIDLSLILLSLVVCLCNVLLHLSLCEGKALIAEPSITLGEGDTILIMVCRSPSTAEDE